MLEEQADKAVKTRVAVLRGQKRDGERGYALLVLIGFAAILMAGITVSLQKASFEGRRDREEELIFRGSQYQRAIQLFYRKFGRYPNSVDELVQTNNIRFLRKKFADPMSKEGEWRTIRVGPNGALIGALTNPLQGLIANAAAVPGSNPSQPGAAGQATGQTTGSASPQSSLSGIPQAGLPPDAGQSPGAGSSFGAPGQTPGQASGPAAAPGIGTLGQPGAPTDPSQFPSANPGANPYSQTPPAGQGPQTSVSSAPYSNPQSIASSQGSQPIAASGPIAGFASQSKDSSIRVLNGYDEYDKWEFIFDPRLDPLTAAKAAAQAPAQTPPGAPAQQPPASSLPPGQPGAGPGQGSPNFRPPQFTPPIPGINLPQQR